MSKTALVTGASSGIGEATVRALLEDGYEVFAGARRLERMTPLEKLDGRVVFLDLTDDASIVSAVEFVKPTAGRLRRSCQQRRLRLSTARSKMCRSPKRGGCLKSACSASAA